MMKRGPELPKHKLQELMQATQHIENMTPINTPQRAKTGESKYITERRFNVLDFVREVKAQFTY